jgi:hypothetical protein
MRGPPRLARILLSAQGQRASSGHGVMALVLLCVAHLLMRPASVGRRWKCSCWLDDFCTRSRRVSYSPLINRKRNRRKTQVHRLNRSVGCRGTMLYTVDVIGREAIACVLRPFQTDARLPLLRFSCLNVCTT